LNCLTIDEVALSSLRPSAFTPGNATQETDSLVHASLMEDFPRIRALLPEAYFLDRLGSAIFYRMPWLLSLGRDLSKMNVLELGCGRGLKAIPWSRLFGSYVGVDLDFEVINFARRAAAATKRLNLQFHASNAVEAARDPKRFGIVGRIEMVVLYAVMEHLTPAERKLVLGLCQEVLQDGGMLLIAETPNRLIPHDSHSTHLHFFQTLPPEIALEYAKRSPRPGIADALIGGEEALYRFGQGVSYHEFELWMARRDGKLPAIVSDGWSHWPICDEPLRRDELWLNEYLDAHGPLAPSAFARYWLDAVFDGVGLSGSSPNTPRLARPQQLCDAYVYPDRRFYAPDTIVVQSGGCVTFDLGGGNPTLLLDLAQSVGEITVEDSRGNTMTTLDVEALQAARFPRWHNGCAINLSAFGPLDEIILRPETGRATAVSTGVLVR
jgi:2-polyprenyl-3-methyl-5-hydroxy-6-metoxy-1,4-benzoquinol methylase